MVHAQLPRSAMKRNSGALSRTRFGQPTRKFSAVRIVWFCILAAISIATPMLVAAAAVE
jgi:hypothetical protein